LTIRAFDIQSGWRHAYERQRKHSRRNLLWVNSTQNINKYLDDIPIDQTTLIDKTKKARGKSLPDDEIRSISGRIIPPEWTVNLLALGKEPWRFKDLEDRLNMFPQQWQADQQKQIIAKIAEKMPGKTNEGKRKNNERNHRNTNGGRSGGHQGNNSRGFTIPGR
jgi:hypothetical protein